MWEKYFNIERLIHSTKTAIACFAAFIIAKLIGFSNGLWVVVTVLVVMCAQIYVGSVLWRSYLRFLGTFIGCLFASIALMTTGPTTGSILITLMISSFIFSYIATANETLVYPGTLGAATTAIILLYATPTLQMAAERFLEISTGILIATVISQFVLPIHARTHLRRNQAVTLSKLRDYYRGSIMTERKEEEESYFEEMDEEIALTLSKQRDLAKTAGREPFGAPFNPNIVVQCLHLEKEMLRAINFMHIAMTHIENTEYLFRESTLFKTFNEAVVQSFGILIKAIESEDPSALHIHIPPLAAFKEDLQKRLTVDSHEDMMSIYGFLFSADILTNSFVRLANLFNVALRK